MIGIGMGITYKLSVKRIIQTLEKTEGAIKNEQVRDTGDIGHT